MKKQILIVIVFFLIVSTLAVSSFLFIYWSDIFNLDSNVTMDVTENPFLWRIEGENPSYLFGSIHLANKSVLTLPDIVIEALDEVDAVYTEIKLDPATQTISDQLSRLPEGQTLEDLLPQDVYDRLDSYLKSKGISLVLLSQYKIWAITSSLTLLDEIQNLINYPTLDQYIWNLAASNGKYTDGIETIEEQVGFFDDFSTEEQIEMLNGTLDELDEYGSEDISITSIMLDAYLEGDLQVLQNFTLSGVDEEDPLDVKFITRLITDRNYNMTQRITQFINDNPETQYFFAVGAGHYYGEDGLITLLENEGFTVTRVEFNVCNECDDGETMINQRCYDLYT